jgi:four helix bundle protein
MKKKSYRDLFIWQSSVDLAVRMIELTDKYLAQRFALVDQIQRAASSVPANIAEGQGRLTTRDERHFVCIARGSLYELRTHLDIVVRAGLIPAHEVERLHEQMEKLSAGINRYIARLSSTTTPLHHSTTVSTSDRFKRIRPQRLPEE